MPPNATLPNHFRRIAATLAIRTYALLVEITIFLNPVLKYKQPKLGGLKVNICIYTYQCEPENMDQSQVVQSIIEG